MRVYPFLLAGLMAACNSLPQDKPKPEAFQPAQVKAQAEVAPSSAFADQTGGGVFVTTAGELVRLRLDGTKAPLENHPGNPVTPGRGRSVFRMGPGSALVETDNGLFLAQAGWIIAPPWRAALSVGMSASVVTPDGSAWLAHASGLFQLRDGALSQLKVDGQPLVGISSLVVAPAEGVSPALWFIREEKLWNAIQTAAGTWQVRQAQVPLNKEEAVVGLAGLGESEKGAAEVWLLTSERLLRNAADGWREVALEEPPEQVVAAGRFVWVKTADGLFLHDADKGTWGQASGVDTGNLRLLTADESGCVWAKVGADTVAFSRGPVPRVLGLHEGMRVVEDSLVVRARVAPGDAPESVTFQVAGMDLPVSGPAFSLGGVEADGTPKPFSFDGLAPGVHTLSAVARYANGTEARRAVSFSYQPVSTSVLSWEKDIRPIHVARCASCHTSGPGRQLSTYQLWKDNAALIVAAVRDQRMPADGPLDPQLISIIQRWATAGANP
ncbi:hypothetical protein [Archangium lipolyticum]|uniref:hypothetical protein n=1 Tax=Archangium lipolyticum TaxID=2970465 RepID=UPI002149CD40|nr:hypothetical protein [Archangium lipolyticum]